MGLEEILRIHDQIKQEYVSLLCQLIALYHDVLLQQQFLDDINTTQIKYIIHRQSLCVTHNHDRAKHGGQETILRLSWVFRRNLKHQLHRSMGFASKDSRYKHADHIHALFLLLNLALVRIN